MERRFHAGRRLDARRWPEDRTAKQVPIELGPDGRRGERGHRADGHERDSGKGQDQAALETPHDGRSRPGSAKR